MIFVDSDVLLIDLRYRRDPKYKENAAFLAGLKHGKQQGITSIFNVLEVCGILSYNLNEQQLLNLYCHLPTHYNLQIYPPSKEYLPRLTVKSILAIISKKASFGDALIIYTIRNMGPLVSHYVSWNARHFLQQLSIPALTPAEALETGILKNAGPE